MIITYRYKLYRSKKNKHLLQTIDLAGRAYNHCIALHKRYYKLTGKHLNQYALMKHLTRLKKRPKFAWMSLIPSQALQDVVQRIEKGYQLFYRNRKAGIKSAPPSFRKLAKFKSYTLKQAGWKLLDSEQSGIRCQTSRAHAPDCEQPGCSKVKIAGRIYKFCHDRPLAGHIKTVTVKRDTPNDLYVCFSLEVEDSSPAPTTGKMAGFDFGLKTFLTVSDGTEIQSPEFFKQGLNEIRRANRSLSRKARGSHHRRQAKWMLAKLHKRIADQRRDWFFKLANELISQYDCLFFENLNLNGMKRLWGRKMSDLAFGEFLSILKWTAQKKGKIIHLVDRFYPSSKTCQYCGLVNSNLSLNDRRWRCPSCQKVVDRDGNAAVNILREGASSLAGAGVRPGLSGQLALIAEPHRL
jgi:putative transposase